MLAVLHNTPFTDMNDSEAETQIQGYGAFALGGRALELLAHLIGAVTIDTDRVRRNIELSAITVTELADTMVRTEAMSFTEAHGIASVVARGVLAAGGTLAGDGFPMFEREFVRLRGGAPSLDADRFRTLLSPEHFVAVRTRFGGPAPAPMEAAFTRYDAEIVALNDAGFAVAARANAAALALDAAFARLLGMPR